MGCCRRKVVIPTRPNVAATPAFNPAIGPQVIKHHSKLCEDISKFGADIVVNIVQYVITIDIEGRKFDIFSASEAMGCEQSDWLMSIKKSWGNLSQSRKDNILNTLGKKMTARTLMDHIMM